MRLRGGQVTARKVGKRLAIRCLYVGCIAAGVYLLIDIAALVTWVFRFDSFAIVFLWEALSEPAVWLKLHLLPRPWLDLFVASLYFLASASAAWLLLSMFYVPESSNSHCARCGYDLRGIPNIATCPECGFPVAPR